MPSKKEIERAEKRLYRDVSELTDAITTHHLNISKKDMIIARDTLHKLRTLSKKTKFLTVLKRIPETRNIEIHREDELKKINKFLKKLDSRRIINQKDLEEFKKDVHLLYQFLSKETLFYQKKFGPLKPSKRNHILGFLLFILLIFGGIAYYMTSDMPEENNSEIQDAAPDNLASRWQKVKNILPKDQSITYKDLSENKQKTPEVEESCKSTKDCNVGSCIGGKCNFLSRGDLCTYSKECIPPNACIGGICTSTKSKLGGTCKFSSDCQPGLGCFKGKCVTKRDVGKPCEDYTTCKESLRCQDGKCFKGLSEGVKCNKDSECGGGTVCIDVCTVAPSTGDFCLNSNQCNPDECVNNRCVESSD